jgi:hypothetical protein
MCCFFTTLLFFGPRLAFLIYWLVWPVRVYAVLDTWIWPLLGLIFLPWTFLMYVIVATPGPGLGLIGFDWVWVGLALLADIAGYAGGVQNRSKVPGYPGP